MTSFDARQYSQYDAVTPEECGAMRLLVRSGRTRSGIAFALERNEKTVIRHVAGDCDCQSGITPIAESTGSGGVPADD